MIKVLIGDDHPLIRQGLKKTLEQELGISVVCEASNGQEILDMVESHKPDVVVMDLTMPGLNGLDVLKELKHRVPKLPVLILSMHPEERFGLRVLKAGAAGYLTKENAPEGLIAAIRKVVSGGRYITPTLGERLAFELEQNSAKAPHELLSDREFQIFCLLASGSSVREISEKLFLSINTVNTYRSRMFEKMHIRTTSDAIQYAIRYKLVDL